MTRQKRPNGMCRATRPRLSASLRLAAILSGGLLLAGCMKQRDVTASIPDDYRDRHPISIKEGQRTVELFIGSGRGGLSPAQRADVTALASAWRREATGAIVIDVPSGTPNSQAAASAVQEIRSILSAFGLPPNGVYVRPYRPINPSHLATVRLRYAKIVADAGPCGLWPDNLGPTYDSQWTENRPYYNLGCATQRNLAAMVDNPADLVQPRAEQPAYTARRTETFEKYRTGDAVKTDPNADKAKISDVGK